MGKFFNHITTTMCDDVYNLLTHLPVFSEAPTLDKINFVLERGLDDKAFAYSYRDGSYFTVEIDIDQHKDLRVLIGTIAHELCHIILNDYDEPKQHGKAFMKMLDTVEKQIGIVCL